MSKAVVDHKEVKCRYICFLLLFELTDSVKWKLLLRVQYSDREFKKTLLKHTTKVIHAFEDRSLDNAMNYHVDIAHSRHKII